MLHLYDTLMLPEAQAHQAKGPMRVRSPRCAPAAANARPDHDPAPPGPGHFGQNGY